MGKILLKKSKKSTSISSSSALNSAKEVSKESPKEWTKSNPYSTHSQNEHIDEILKESKAALSKAEKEPKKGRGRPKGSLNRSSDSGSGAVPNLDSNNESSSIPGASENSGGPGVGESLPPEAVKPILQFPFKAAALKTGFKGWELSDGEADGLAPIAASVAKKYMGSSASPYAQEILLASTLAIFVGMKYMAMLEWRAMQREANEEMVA